MNLWRESIVSSEYTTIARIAFTAVGAFILFLFYLLPVLSRQ